MKKTNKSLPLMFSLAIEKKPNSPSDNLQRQILIPLGRVQNPRYMSSVFYKPISRVCSLTKYPENT